MGSLGAVVAPAVASATPAVTPAAVAALWAFPSTVVIFGARLAFAACRETVSTEALAAAEASTVAPAVAVSAAKLLATCLGRSGRLGGLAAAEEAFKPSKEPLLLGGGLRGRRRMLAPWALLILGVVARVARLPGLPGLAGIAGLARFAGVPRYATLALERVAAGLAGLWPRRPVFPSIGTERGPLIALGTIGTLA